MQQQPMIKQTIIFAFLIAYMLTFVARAMAYVEQPVARQGVIDLRAVNWDEQQSVSLNGEWTFYWNQLQTPATIREQAPSAQSSYKQVPSTWKDGAVIYQSYPNHGYATYRLLLQLREEDVHKRFAIYMPSVATAYQLWINGELMEKNGVVGTSREQMVPKNYTKLIPFQSDRSQVELVVQVSNFVQRKGGLWESITLGPVEEIMLERDTKVLYESLIASCLFLMGIYHFVLYLARKREKSSLYFSGMSIGISIRLLFLGETLAVRYFPQIPWEIGVKLEYLCASACMMFLSLFVHSQYPLEFNRTIRNWLIKLGSVLVLFVTVTPAWIFTEAILIKEIYLLLCYCYVLYVYVHAVIRKRHGSLLNGFGLMLLFVASINEILFYANLSTFENGVAFSVLVFLFTQMINLSMAFARSFDQVERLSEELRKTNESLEQKVQQRTQALEGKNKELQMMQESRRRLLSNIAHELGTPLTSIQGFIKAMIDGVVKPNDPKYLNILYEKTIYLHQIIKDLFELSKIESRQIHFHFQPIPLISYFHNLYEKHLLDMEKKDLHFVWELGTRIVPDDRLCIIADPLRVEQVVVNLLTNAQRYTPTGGTISLRIDSELGPDGTGRAFVEVRDTGLGIDAENLPFIFERFFKVSDARKARAGGGVGLGLTISKEIIQYHQGDIWVESTLGAGSTFSFSLPVKRMQTTTEPIEEGRVR
ncbi:sensor histidine kinase [Brevibacillus reuszeri]|uniref:sensor histidine kinase n=1 Tax=Brevibacillus reuszeri TaxID=54915 RepID=UPI0013DEFF43|nr:sensor histidine kinase [Brevibacillus reuszeri]